MLFTDIKTIALFKVIGVIELFGKPYSTKNDFIAIFGGIDVAEMTKPPK